MTGVISPVMETIDRFLIGMVLGAKAVAHYTIAYQLVTKVRILPASLSRALFPRFSADTVEANDLALTSFSVLIAVMTPVIVLGVLLVEPFLTLWVGQGVAQHAAPVAQILLVGVWVNSLAYIPLVLLQGSGRPGLVAKLHMAELLPFLAILYYATTKWGIIGAAVAWTTRVIADSLLLYLAAGIAKDVMVKALIPLTMVLVGLFIAFFVSEPWMQLSSGSILTISVVVWLSTTPIAAFVRTYLMTRVAGIAK